jgi:hypothetical protein
MPAFSRPLADCPDAALAAVAGVLTDIDDTLTHDGGIEARGAAGAGTRCAMLDVPVMAITGRPMGWSEPFARDWPVGHRRRERRRGAAARGRRAAHRIRPGRGHAGANAQAPARGGSPRAARGAGCARWRSDSAGRVTDIAIDHSEFVHLQRRASAGGGPDAGRGHERHRQLHPHQRLVRQRTTKWSGAQWMRAAPVGRNAARPRRDRWVYVGDSTNDQLMFEHYPLSVGVANLRALPPS